MNWSILDTVVFDLSVLGNTVTRVSVGEVDVFESVDTSVLACLLALARVLDSVGVLCTCDLVTW